MRRLGLALAVEEHKLLLYNVIASNCSYKVLVLFQNTLIFGREVYWCCRYSPQKYIYYFLNNTTQQKSLLIIRIKVIFTFFFTFFLLRQLFEGTQTKQLGGERIRKKSRSASPSFDRRPLGTTSPDVAQTLLVSTSLTVQISFPMLTHTWN